VAFLHFLVHLHGCNLTVQLIPPHIDFGEPLGALLRDFSDGSLESRPGRRHQPRHGRRQGGLQIPLQRIQRNA
jgi:hypothetical protein